ncbi:MAG: DUF87 domain-containing protein [Asgard group archaeon]|nr:DUF87 domain-containing protein [Asgard group archaeon]
MFPQEIIQLASQKTISIKKVKQIPYAILNDNISLVEYGTQNFQSICQLTQIKDKQINNQFFIGKTNKNQNIEAAFSGIEIMTGIELENICRVPLEKSNDEFDGLIVFQDIPPKMKSIVTSDNINEYQSKNAFDHCIDVCINALPLNYQSWILSTIEKKRFGLQINFSKKFNWKKASIISLIFFWISLIVGLPPFFLWKFKNITFMQDEIPSMIDITFFMRLRAFIEDPNVLLGLGFWSFFLITGLVSFVLFIRRKKGMTNKSFSFKSEGKEIADKKETTAFTNHDEEKAQWGEVNQSFVILVCGKELTTLRYILESLKLAVEGIYRGCIFGIEGTIILPDYEKTKYNNRFKCFFGWTIESFWKAFENVRPFKPTIMSIPRSGKNYFRLIKEKFIPGTEIIEGTPYKIPIERTIGDWFLGKVYRKIGQESYPYYLTPDVLTRQGLIVGQTGRGKTFLMHKMLEQISKFNPEIHHCIFDLKGGEYTRFFAKKSTVYIPGSDVAPLAINIFRIYEEDIESNKRLVSLLLNEFLLHKVGSLVELSAFMKDVVNQAIDLVFLQPNTNRTMRTFVKSINIVLEELEEDGLGWIEKTRTALKARFRELYTGWFRKIFCVKESNYNVEMLQEQNVIFKLNHLVSDNDLPTIKFLVNLLMGLISSYSKELRDLDSNKPWLVCVFEEAQKIIPLIQKRDTSEATTIENFVEIGRAHGVVSIAIGQSPSKISDRFHQAGFIADFGTESIVLDKTVFGKDFLNAPAEKEQLATTQMCFLKLTGERRVLLKVDDFDYTNALSEQQLEELFTTNSTYHLLREQYNHGPISLEDLAGKSGKKRLAKKKLFQTCLNDCVYKTNICQTLENYRFAKYKLPRKKKKQLLEMLAKERGRSFIRFCHHIAEDKKDADCILLYYLTQIIDLEIMDSQEAEFMLLRGKDYYLSVILEQEELDKAEELEAILPLEEIEQDYQVYLKEREKPVYSFNFHNLLVDEEEM